MEVEDHKWATGSENRSDSSLKQSCTASHTFRRGHHFHSKLFSISVFSSNVNGASASKSYEMCQYPFWVCLFCLAKWLQSAGVSDFPSFCAPAPLGWRPGSKSTQLPTTFSTVFGWMRSIGKTNRFNQNRFRLIPLLPIEHDLSWVCKVIELVNKTSGRAL